MPFRFGHMAAAATMGFGLMAAPALAQYTQDSVYTPPNYPYAPQGYPAANSSHPGGAYQPASSQETYRQPAYAAPQYQQMSANYQPQPYQAAPQYGQVSSYGGYGRIAQAEPPAPAPPEDALAPAPAPYPAPLPYGGPAHYGAPIAPHNGSMGMHGLNARLDNPPGLYDGACGPAGCGPAAYPDPLCAAPVDPCCEPCCEGGLIGGFECLWIKPRFEDCTVLIIDPASSNIGQGADYDYELSPRVWAGYQHCDGLGFRLTYWQLDSDMNSMSHSAITGAEPVYVEVYGANGSYTRSAFAGTGGGGETLHVDHSLRLQTADFEITQAFNTKRTAFLFGAGLRYGRLESDFDARAVNAAGVIDERVTNYHDFEGFGPTLSMMMSRPFGDKGLGFYVNARTSILFGDRNQTITELKAGATAPVYGTDTASGDEALIISELGVGLMYARPIKHNCIAFVRGGYEGQVWFDAGNPVNTRGDMVLEGLSLAFGIMR